jgi:hypothetical protein
MSSPKRPEDRLRELTESRFKTYTEEVLAAKSWSEHDAGKQAAREKRRRDFVGSLGIDLKKFDAGLEKDNHAQEAELKSFLAAFRPKSANRRSMRAADARAAASRSAVLAESGHTVLPSFAASIFAAEKAQLAPIVGQEWITGPIDSGWVFPDDPSHIRIMDSRHYPNALCWDNRQTPYPQFASHFSFIPAETGTYEMTAVLAFHGFYVLRCDDSWWNCRDASVNLTVQMNAHQYDDIGWKGFPALLDVENDNTEQVTNFDRTFFLDYTAELRAGDPVIVTAQGTVKASAHGGGAYAELNFADGTANYVWPLFLSVQRV